MSKSDTLKSTAILSAARESAYSAKRKEEAARKKEEMERKREIEREKKREKHNERAEALREKRAAREERKREREAEREERKREREARKRANGGKKLGSMNVKGIVGKLRYVPLGEGADSSISRYVMDATRGVLSDAVARLKEGDAQGASDVIFGAIEGQKTELLNTMFQRVHFPVPDGGEITPDYAVKVIEHATGIDLTNEQQVASAGNEGMMSICRERLGISFIAMGYNGEALGEQDLVDVIVAGMRSNKWSAMQEYYPSIREFCQRAKALANFGITLDEYKRVKAIAASRDYKARQNI